MARMCSRMFARAGTTVSRNHYGTPACWSTNAADITAIRSMPTRPIADSGRTSVERWWVVDGVNETPRVEITASQHEWHQQGRPRERLDIRHFDPFRRVCNDARPRIGGHRLLRSSVPSSTGAEDAWVIIGQRTFAIVTMWMNKKPWGWSYPGDPQGSLGGGRLSTVA